MTPRSRHNREALSPLSASQRVQLCEMIDQYELAADKGEILSLENLCEGAPELLAHLIASLRRLRSLDSHLSTIAELPMPEVIGEFKVLEPIGAGSTGMVFRCRQTNPDRDVAVKVLKPLLDVDEQQNRFQREMAAVSAIDEAGMADVYQTGIVEWGGVRCLWIAMELLDGGDICKALKNQSLDEMQVLEKFRVVCETLRAAHRLGILHRDIKPSNILMSNDGMPHLVDFGIAKLPGSFAGVQPTETGTRSAQGTAAWMAPELLLATSQPQSDVRCEIFSLGVVLFEMLSGQHPFGAEQLAVPQVAARMSQRIQVSLGDLRPASSPDLVAFVSKLMAFDAGDRYQNLDAVLQDLDLLVRGEPVTARAVSIRELTVRWCRRHRMRASIAAGIFLTVLGVLTAGWITTQRIHHQAELLKSANGQLNEQATVLQKQALELTESLRLRDRTISNGTLRSLQYVVETSPHEVQRTLNDPGYFPEDQRGFAWNLLNFESASDVQILPNSGGPVKQLTFDPTGRFLLVTSDPGQLTKYDLKTGEQSVSAIKVLPLATVAFRNHGESVLVVSADHKFLELSVADGKQIREFLFLSGLGLRFAVSDDGKTFVGLNSDRIPVLADLDSGRIHPLSDAINTKPIRFWFTDDGKVANCFDRDHGWRTWRVATAELLPQSGSFPKLDFIERLHSIDFTTQPGNGELLALGMSYGLIHLVSRDAERFTFRSIQVQGDTRMQLKFLPPSHLITSGRTVQIHDLTLDQRPRFLTSQQSSPAAAAAHVAAVSPDIQWIAVGDENGTVSITRFQNADILLKSYYVFRGNADRGFGFPKSLRTLIGKSQFLIGHTGGWIANVDLKSGEPIETFPICKGPVNSIDIHPDGRFVAVGNSGDDQSITVLMLSEDGRFCPEVDGIFREPPKPVMKMELKADVRTLKFTDDGESLLAALRNGELLRVECTHWHESGRWKCHDGGIFGMDTWDNVCATGGTDGIIRLTNIKDGSELRRWEAHSKRIVALQFSPDGTRIYSASHDGEIRIWNRAGDRLQSLMAHEGRIACLKLSKDGMTLVSGGHDRRILIWDAITGDLQREVEAHRDQLTDLEFLPNDNGLLSSGLDSETHLWGDGTIKIEPRIPSQ